MASKSRTRRVLLPAFGTALVAALAFSVIGAASASAATQHWYVGGKKLAESTPTEVTLKGTTTFTLKWTVGGAAIEVQCTTQSGGGKIENPAKGAAGIIYSSPSILLSKCTVKKPAKCFVFEPIGLYPTGGEAVEFGGKPAVKFNPSGLPFTTIEFTGIECGLKGWKFEFLGSFTGTANGATSSLEFTEASSEITFGGKPVTLQGTSKIETTTGKTVTVAP